MLSVKQLHKINYFLRIFMSSENQIIKVIIGLGNPGPKYYKTRHSIGFRVVDELGARYGAHWNSNSLEQSSEIMIDERKILLVKPQTFMNASGKVIPGLLKKGIKPGEILVVHDELEKPFGYLGFKSGGSHKGHNGLRSIIEACGPDFERFRFGIGRPEHKEAVNEYVIEPFSKPEEEKIGELIHQAIEMIENKLK